MKTANQYLTALFIFAFTQSNVFADGEEYEHISIKEYKEALLVLENRGGSLYCPDLESDKQFSDCKSFESLREKGCYGYSTAAMRMESRYSNNCMELNNLRKAKTPKQNFFDLSTKIWWQELPADIIPISGGVNSDESWKSSKDKRDSMVKGKLMKDLDLHQVSTFLDRVEIVIAVKQMECGEIQDYMEIDTIVFADFNNDEIAELMLKGHRVDRSETCPLGSGNSLGAEFTAILSKSSQHHRIKKLK